ncbi:hypothetical protein M1D72_01560 [Vibrio sp. AK197]
MNKIVFALLLISPIVAAETVSTEAYKNMSVSVQSLSSSNTFTIDSDWGSTEVDDDSEAYALRLSWYSEDASFCEVCERVYFIEYMSEEFDLGVYDSDNNNLATFSVGFQEEFSIPAESIGGIEGLTPYFQIALGLGFMDISGYSESSASTLSLKGDIGLAYYIQPALRLHMAIGYQGRHWTSVDMSGVELSIDDQSVIGSFGVSYRF